MPRPMLGDLELQQVQAVGVDQDRVLAEHQVPALEGDFLQRLGRRASSVSLSGVVTGAEAGAGLKGLRDKFRTAEPVAFVADIATATRVDKVLIEALSVRELAGRPERFEYAIRIREYIQPPPVSEEPPIPPPEPRDTETTTLVVEVASTDTDIDPSQATVTAKRAPAEGEEASAAGGEVRTLTTHEGAVWTEQLPPGQWTVEATVTDPRPVSGTASATLQPGQTSRVTITLGPVSAVAQMFVVHFWFDRAFVEPCMRRVLADVVEHARTHTDEKLVIVGHTDKVGSDEYNQSLSERRARAVFSFLTFGRDRAGALTEWHELRQPHPPGTVRMLADNWGPGLREAQHMLQDLGFYPGDVDDRGGPQTQEAIRAFRCQSGLPPGTTMDDPTWDKLIERYLAQDSFRILESQFLPNCPGEILKWIGCGEKDPVRNVQFAWRPNRRVELLFVRVSRLPADVPQPDTFDLPSPGAVNAAWCLNPSGTPTRCDFMRPATQPCAGAPPTQFCRPTPPARFTVTGKIQREVRAVDGSVTFAPAANARFVLIDPEGKIEGAEDSRGAPVAGQTSDGTFRFDNRLPGVYDVRISGDAVARLATETDAGAKGNAVCRVVRSAADTIDVVIALAPALREIVLPTAAHVMTALHPSTRAVRTCPAALAGQPPLTQASPLTDADVRAAFDDAASVWVQGRVRPNLVDIVHEAYSFRTDCEVDDAEFETVLTRCAYRNVLNVYFFADLAGAGEAGLGVSVESGAPDDIYGCALTDRFTFIGADISLSPEQRGQVLAHEIGHYLNLAHTSAAGQLMLPGTFTGLNRKLDPAEVTTARASQAAGFECMPFSFRVSNARQIGGSLSTHFIVIVGSPGPIQVDAQITAELNDPAVGSLMLTGGDPGAGPLQRTIDTSTGRSAPVIVSGTYAPVGGRPLERRVDVSVATFVVDVLNATRVGAGDTFIATTDATAPVVVRALLSPEPMCVPDTLVSWSGGDANPDPLRRNVSRTTGGQTVVSATVAGVTRTVTIVVVRVTVDVDADRDGVVGLNETGKNTWAFGAGQKGAILLANVDNDDKAAGNTQIDNENVVVDGAGDVPDLAELIIRDPGTLPAGTALRLTASDRSKIRIFDQRTAGRTAVLGPAPLPASFILPAGPSGDRVFGMEATQLPNTGFDGLIRITVELRQGATVLGSDQVTVRVAPWVMPSHLDRTIETYVMDDPPFNGAVFMPQLVAAHAGTGVTLRQVPIGPFGLDPWVQDVVEIGFNGVPGRTSHVALNATNPRGLQPFARQVLLGPDYGLIDSPLRSVPSTFDSHGNLEVSPPVTVGGKEFKLGRMYHGRGRPGEDFNPAIKDLLQAQLVQAPFEVDTDFLAVGHVDEIFSFVPASSGKPFRLLVADTNETLRILRAVQAGGNGTTSVLKGTTGKFRRRTVNALLGDAALLSQNATICQPGIDRALATMVSELGLDATADVIKIPTFFVEDAPGAGQFEALFPGVVNMLVITGGTFAGHRLVPPKAFGPVVGGRDQFEEDVRTKLATIGYAAGQISFVDDFDSYHVGDGEVHCATNSKRVPPTTNWWEQVP